MDNLVVQLKGHGLIGPDGIQHFKTTLGKGFDVVSNQTDDVKFKVIDEQIDELKYGYSNKKDVLESFLEKCLLNFFMLISVQYFQIISKNYIKKFVKEISGY